MQKTYNRKRVLNTHPVPSAGADSKIDAANNSENILEYTLLDKTTQSSSSSKIVPLLCTAVSDVNV